MLARYDAIVESRNGHFKSLELWVVARTLVVMPELQLRVAFYKSEISNSARIFCEISRKCATLIGCSIIHYLGVDRPS